MSAEERLAAFSPADLIGLIAKRSAGFAAQAGVGAMETAGGLISYLSKHPEDIEPWINGGFFELPMGWWELGDLTWHAQKSGAVVHPADVRNGRLHATADAEARHVKHALFCGWHEDQRESDCTCATLRARGNSAVIREQKA